MRRRISRHRKMTDKTLAWVQEQAMKRIEIERQYAVLPDYDAVAAHTGLTRGSARVLMAQLMRDIRSGETRMRRGNDSRETALHEVQGIAGRAQW